jgi:hypothetical protein
MCTPEACTTTLAIICSSQSRKVRIGDPKRGKGKRGGVRVIYLHLPEIDQIHRITIYGKDQKDDLSTDDRTTYRQLVKMLIEQSRRAIER